MLILPRTDGKRVSLQVLVCAEGKLVHTVSCSALVTASNLMPMEKDLFLFQEQIPHNILLCKVCCQGFLSYYQGNRSARS